MGEPNDMREEGFLYIQMMITVTVSLLFLGAIFALSHYTVQSISRMHAQERFCQEMMAYMEEEKAQIEHASTTYRIEGHRETVKIYGETVICQEVRGWNQKGIEFVFTTILAPQDSALSN